MSIVKEFKDFAMRGNVVDLAVGIIIGAAFGKIVSSFVADIVMPLINPLIPKGDWQSLQIGTGIKIGNFIGTVLDFLIIAIAVFFMVKLITRLYRKETVAAPPTKQEILLTEIRDLLKTNSEMTQKNEKVL